MTEYPEDAPTMSADAPENAPTVSASAYSEAIYDYPETGPTELIDTPSQPSWLPLVAVIGVCIAVVVVVIAATVTIFPIRPAQPTTVISIATPTPPPPSTVTSAVTTPVPGPTVTAPPPPPSTVVVSPTAAAPPQIPTSGCPQRLVNQAAVDYVLTSAQAVGYWVPQLSSKRSGLVADGMTWDCEAIWAEHMRLRSAYNAKLLWSGDWPQTYRNDNYWVTVAGMIYPTAEGARQWCVEHGRDIPAHCYPTQIQ